MRNKLLRNVAVALLVFFVAFALVGCSTRNDDAPPSWYGVEPPPWYGVNPPEWWDDRDNPPPWHGQNPPAWWDGENNRPMWYGLMPPAWWDVENNRPYWDGEEPPEWWGKLDPAIELRIRQDLIDLVVEIDSFYDGRVTLEHVSVSMYLGTFNGYVVVLVNFYMMFPISALPFLDDIQFSGPGWSLAGILGLDLVWNEGRFYRFHTAYTEGILTRDNFDKIQEQNDIWGHPSIP